jgi:hypothetical protein
VKQLVALGAFVAGLLFATPAAAAPELFVRLSPWDTHEAVSDWIPLASAPSLNYLGGYEIGYRLETSGFQRVALTVDGVPDGRPTQPSNATPYCVGRNGTAGEIVGAGPELQFEGTGAYTVTVSVGPDLGCLAGASTTGSFTVTVPVSPSIAGMPQTFRVKPLAGRPFVGVTANQPPGGSADVRCALDAAVQPDGSVAGAEVVGAGPSVPESVFTRPGDWTCVARGVAEGRDDNLDTVEFATPWSAPLAVGVGSDFQRRLGEVARPRAKRPRFTFTAVWPALAQGGRATITLFRVTGCRGKRFRQRRVAVYRGAFGARPLRVAMRRPRAGFFVGRFAFAGTRLLRAGVDPSPMLLTVQRGRMGFVDPRGFPRCPGYRP